ncbi:MAG: hypothetical protein GY701_10100 [Sulfitobacter sp.]|nr:hypothetical protein [Sulfitobacter sp.]
MLALGINFLDPIDKITKPEWRHAAVGQADGGFHDELPRRSNVGHACTVHVGDGR